MYEKIEEEATLFKKATYEQVTYTGEVNVYNGAGVKSIRIEKEKAGQATGFWKGITSTEAQEFTYTVGVTSSTTET